MRITRKTVLPLVALIFITQFHATLVAATPLNGRGGYNSPSSRVLYQFFQNSKAILLSLWALKPTYYAEQQDYRQSSVSRLYLPTQLVVDLYQGQWSWGGYAYALANLPLQLAEQQLSPGNTRRLVRLAQSGLLVYATYHDPAGTSLRIILPASIFLAMQSLRKMGYPLAKWLKSWVYLGGELAVSPLSRLIQQLAFVSNKLETVKKDFALDEKLLFGGRALPSGRSGENHYIALKRQQLLDTKARWSDLLSQSRWQTLSEVTPPILSAFLASRLYPSYGAMSVIAALPLAPLKFVRAAPYVKNPILDQYALVNQTFSWRLPYDTFGGTRDGMFTSVTGVNNTALPNWLQTKLAQAKLLGGLDLSGNVNDVFVNDTNKLAYLAAGDLGLVIANVSDPSNPVMLDNFPTYPAEAVNVVNDKAYVIGWDGLAVLGVSQPRDIKLLGNASVSAGRAVTVVDDIAYVGGWDFILFNISQPYNISRLATIDLPGSVGDISVVGDIAYVANFLSSSSTGLDLFNISQPSNISLLGSINTPGAARAVTIAKQIAYVIDSQAGLSLFNISKPENISWLGSFYTSSSIQNVDVVNDIAYVADWSEGFKILNVSQPGNISVLNSVNTAGYAVNLMVLGNIAYIADYSAGLALYNLSQRHNISQLNNISLLSTLDTSGKAKAITVVNDIAYVADSEAGLKVFDVSQPHNISLLTSIDTPGYATDIKVSGGIAYIADNFAGLSLFNISQLNNIRSLGRFNTPSAYGIYVANNIAYLADGTLGLALFNVSQPRNISLLDSIGTSGTAIQVSTTFPMDFTVTDDVIYLPDWKAGLKTFNNSQPTAITLLDSIDTTGWARGLTVVNNIAYLADSADLSKGYMSALYLFNISQPHNISLLNRHSMEPFLNLFSVTVTDSIAYVVGTSGVQLLNISQPQNISQLSIIPGMAHAISIVGNVLYATSDYTIKSYNIAPNITGTPIDTGVFPLSLNLVNNSGHIFASAPFNLIVGNTPSLWPNNYPSPRPTFIPTGGNSTVLPTARNLTMTPAPHRRGRGPQTFPYNINPWVLLGASTAAGCSVVGCIWCAYHQCQKHRRTQENIHPMIGGLSPVRRKQPSIEMPKITPLGLSPRPENHSKDEKKEPSNSSSDLFNEDEIMYNNDLNTTTDGPKTQQNSDSSNEDLFGEKKDTKQNQTEDNNNTNTTDQQQTEQPENHNEGNNQNETVEGGDVPAD